MAKIDAVTMNNRVNQVVDRMLSGQATTAIIEQIMKTWKVNRAQAYLYIKKAFAVIREANQHSVKQKLDRHLSVRWRLFEKIKEKNTAASVRASVRVLDSIAKLEGLLTDKIDLTTAGNKIGAVTIFQIPDNGRDSKIIHKAARRVPNEGTK